jgi:hypothetical protein
MADEGREHVKRDLGSDFTSSRDEPSLARWGPAEPHVVHFARANRTVEYKIVEWLSSRPRAPPTGTE